MPDAPPSTEQVPDNRWTRRRFVRLLLLGTVVNLLASGSLAAFFSAGGRQRSLVVAALRRHLPGLGFTDRDYQRFAAARWASAQVVRTRGEALLAWGWPIYATTSWLERSRLAGRLERWSERVVTDFLLSTDYFDRARSGAPRYVALHTAGFAGCGNPLAWIRSADGRGTRPA